MGTPQHEESTWIFKLLVYIAGVMLGLGAKLAGMNKRKQLTWKVALADSAVALAAAFLVYQLLYTTGHEKQATICSVICGRYADDVLRLSLAAVKKFLINMAGELKNDGEAD